VSPRPAMLAGGAAGCLWAAGVVWIGVRLVEVPVFALLPTLASAFIGPGLVLVLIVLVLSLRRVFDDTLADGEEPRPFSGADIDARVLRNTLEQVAVALCLWPATAYLATGAGPGIVATLGVAFVPARLAYWAGYRLAPSLRMFGFAATFYATVFAFVFAVFSAIDFAAGVAPG